MRELSRLFDSLGLPETLHLPGTINYLVHTVEAQALMMAFRVDFSSRRFGVVAGDRAGMADRLSPSRAPFAGPYLVSERI